MLSEDGLLASALGKDTCVTLAEGDVSNGGSLVMSSCGEGQNAADGPGGSRVIALAALVPKHNAGRARVAQRS